jgi:hypothetical protein
MWNRKKERQGMGTTEGAEECPVKPKHLEFFINKIPVFSWFK